jgi:hypothetical protein
VAANAKKPIEVEPRPDGRWAAQRQGTTRASSVHSTQKQAETKGRAQAKRDRTEFILKGENGCIRERDSYGNDPRSRPG